MPRFEFVDQNEKALISAQACSATMETTRTGRRTASKYRDLLVPSFSLENVASAGGGIDLTIQSACSSASEEGHGVISTEDGQYGQTNYLPFSYSSMLYSSGDDRDVWVTKIEYYPRDANKRIGYNPSGTTIITTPKDQKQETPHAIQQEEGKIDVTADLEQDGDLGGNEPIEVDPEILAAHLYFDKNANDLKISASATIVTSQQTCSIDLSALIKRFSETVWELVYNKDFEEENGENRWKKCGEEANVGVSFDADDETLTYNDVSTYTSTVGDGATATITTGASRYDDDTLTYNDTLTYSDTLTRNDGSYTMDDSNTYRDEETLTTYNEGESMASYIDEEEHRDGVKKNGESVSNEDSSYGSGAFRSPLSDSYRSLSNLPMESRSRSLRSNSRFKISLLAPETSTRSLKIGLVDGTDSLSYSKSRSLNRDLINSFIELKSNSKSSHNSNNEEQLQLQEPMKKNTKPLLVFTLDDVEELEQFETEKREQPEERDQPQPIWRNFDAPSPVIESNCETIPKTEEVSSKAVKITITKTQKLSQGEDQEERREPTDGPIHELSPSPERQLINSGFPMTPPSSSHSRPSIHSRSTSPFRMRHYGRDDEDVDGDDPLEDLREAPESGGSAPEIHKPSYRIAGPVVPVEEDSATISVTEPDAKKKFSVLAIDTSCADGAEDCLSPSSMAASVKLRENLTPMARLRNPISYDILASD